MMDESFVQAIAENSATQVLRIDDREFASRQVYLPPKPDEPECLSGWGLAAAVNYAKMDSKIVAAVQVVSAVKVNVLGARDEFGRVPVLYESKASVPDIAVLRGPVSAEKAIIELNAAFAPTAERDQVLTFLSQLKGESSVHLEDDGIAQKTVVKKGVTGLERVEAKPLRTLAPYLTFPEIAPIETQFLLRLHRQDDNVPLVSLTWADNGNYGRVAMDRIREYLGKALPGVPLI